MDSDAPLQRLTLTHIEESESQLVMEALHHQGTIRMIEEDWMVKRENGLEFDISKFDKEIIIYTKQAYSKRLRIVYPSRVENLDNDLENP
uniref:Transposase n=1 Tax=Caenorhabditis tropicalis TaxID=1561998 RepID=A0A1I7UTR3_9PELO